jgi:peptidyl-prolyl cis-trans isomerase D
LAPYFKKAPTYPELESVPEERPAAADAGAPATKPRPIVSRNATLDDDSSKPRPETTQSFNRGGDPIAELDGETTAKVTSFAFDTKDVKEGSVLPSPVASKDGFLVVQLQQRKTATKEEFAKDRETYTQSLLAAKQAEALALYVKKLRESAKGQIKIDEQYLDEGASKKDGGAPLPEEEGED